MFKWTSGDLYFWVVSFKKWVHDFWRFWILTFPNDFKWALGVPIPWKPRLRYPELATKKKERKTCGAFSFWKFSCKTLLDRTDRFSRIPWRSSNYTTREINSSPECTFWLQPASQLNQRVVSGSRLVQIPIRREITFSWVLNNVGILKLKLTSCIGNTNPERSTLNKQDCILHQINYEMGSFAPIILRFYPSAKVFFAPLHFPSDVVLNPLSPLIFQSIWSHPGGIYIFTNAYFITMKRYHFFCAFSYTL